MPDWMMMSTDCLTISKAELSHGSFCETGAKGVGIPRVICCPWS